MEEKFIPNTEERYSITSDGVIYCNYKYTSTGKKFYKRNIVNKNIRKNSVVVSLQCGKMTKTNRSKTIFVSTLMIDVFKLKKPDTFHMYDLTPKNGDLLDNSLDNLEWRIRCISDIKFYPQPYYDKKGNIISKCCSECGEIKNISCYNMQAPGRPGENITYRNKCTNCRTTERRILINSSEELLEKAKEHSRKFANSEKGKAYHKQYLSAYQNKNREAITDYYISTCLHIPKKELTTELLEIYKKRVTLKRKLENHGKEN